MATHTFPGTFPGAGRPWAELERELGDMRADDIDWRAGRSPLYVFGASDDVSEVGRAAFNMFFTENALGGKRAFKSLGRMEADVLDATLALFSAPADAGAIMTTGGSESLILAVLAARESHRARGGASSPANIVLPSTAHPGFEKATRLMDIEVRRIAVSPDRRADADAMAGAIDKATIMLSGSAPCFPHGLVDPIPALSEVALAHDVWLHVDACVGGYMLPFARELGRDLPAFDFANPGVRSISADLHKFGYCPKPASTLSFRHAEDRDRAAFDFDNWPNGRFTTATMAGTRPGGAVAGAWAVMNYLGREGYLRLTDRALRMARAYADGIAAIEGLELWAQPDLTILNWGSPNRDIFAVADKMAARGWLPGLTRNPPGMHLMASLLHEPVREAFLADLAASVAETPVTVTTGAASADVRYT